MAQDDIRALVRDYYGETLEDSDDLRTNACACAQTAPPKYVLDVFPDLDTEIVDHFYGCGSPLPPALEGCTVLDLGCGTGRDVYIAAKLVGPTGHVIGVDMTPSQLAFAREHEAGQIERLGLPKSNVEFIESYIEDMAAVPSQSVDVVISNCVINLSPFKHELFAEIFRVLKPGGELYFSDIFSDRRVPEGFYDDPILRGECLSGAMYVEDFRRILADLGCAVCYDVAHEPLEVGDFQLATKLGSIRFASRTMRAIKYDKFEDREEDYQQTATYLGTMPENKRYFDLDSDVRFIKDRPLAVSGNMATFLENSRYAKHFKVTPRRGHVGPFDFEIANAALEVVRGKREVDLAWMEDSCKRLGIEPFDKRIHDKELLNTAQLDTMQVNVTYRCNLACNHCYLNCNPNRGEYMSRETMQAVLAAFARGGFRIMDITGGSPEMNPELEWFIEQAAKIADQVLVRTNLCILDDPAYAHFKDVYVANKVKLVSSMPYFDAAGVDEQRGKGSFDSIMKVLRAMNDLGYGIDPALQIDLAYNVDGPFLPPDQADLEDFYRYELQQSEHVQFNGLYALNNWNMGRFASKLLAARTYDDYNELLADNYNGAVVARIMCRTQVNVDYDGALYDCEVNHVLGLPIDGPKNVRDIVDAPLAKRRIKTSPICYSCAAGCGSSCGGSLLEKYAKE
jgi:arsenite methyltransferase